MEEGRWILLPGTLCTGAVFTPMLDALGIAPERRTVVVMDRPRVEDYRAVLSAAGPQDVICGFSLGAIAAAHNLDRAGGRAAVLIACNPRADPPDRRPGRLELSARVAAGDTRAAMAAGWERAVAPARRSDTALKDAITTMAVESADLIAAQTELALSRPGAAAAIASSQMPVLFVTGTDDVVTPPDLAREAATNGDHALAIIPGAGHFLPLERPAETSAAIAGFLARAASS